MNLLKTSIFLFITIIVIPPIAFYLSEPLSPDQMTMLKESGFIALTLALLCFVVGELSQNYSQVDKLWSLAPIIYCWHVTHMAGYTAVLIWMSVLVTIWGLRLSYNFWRRGGYQWKFWAGEEDYRWSVLKAKKGFGNPIVWRLFNLLFICLYQMGLIWLFTMPIFMATKSTSGLGTIEIFLGAGVISMIIIETIADQQQWEFQNTKAALSRGAEQLNGDYKDGFLQSGLWSIVRHPNYAAEQSVWLLFYFIGASASGEWLNWSVIGILLLILLFKSSSDFSEQITATKYPKYAEYASNVPRFIPFTH